MTQTIFVTGIGTGVGETIVSAILTEALQADYWKPVQTGYKNGTDSEWIKSVLSNNQSTIYPEAYKLKLPASPHIAAQNEGIEISSQKIIAACSGYQVPGKRLIIEGARRFTCSAE